MSQKHTRKRDKQLKRNLALCLACQDIIESKHRHDFRWCSCKTIFVDGGKDYLRRGGDLSQFKDLSVWE